MEHAHGGDFLAGHLDQVVADFRLLRVKVATLNEDLLLLTNGIL
jgi:hypothetical protein